MMKNKSIITLSPGANVIKLFFVLVTDSGANQAIVFVPGYNLQSSLIFLDENGSLPQRDKAGKANQRQAL